jgi:hypothetical protein
MPAATTLRSSPPPASIAALATLPVVVPLVVYLAGDAAEAKALGEPLSADPTDGSTEDRRQVQARLRRMYRDYAAENRPEFVGGVC